MIPDSQAVRRYGGGAPLIHSTWLLILLRLRRLTNQMGSLQQLGTSGASKRTGSKGKKSSKIIAWLAWPLMVFAFGALITSAITQLHNALDEPGTFWLTVEFSRDLAIGVTFFLIFLWTSALLLTVASGELAKPEWDLEWLITLPIRSDTLVWARILERSVVQPSGALALITACVIVAWFSGFRWLAPLAGVLAAWPLMLLVSVVRTIVDTGLRLSMKPAQLRNLNAVLSVSSVIVMYLGFSFGLPQKSDFIIGIAAVMPEWLLWTPPGLAVQALNERGFADSLLYFAALFTTTGVLTWLGVLLLRFQLRNGVISGSSREAARSAVPAMANPKASPGLVSRLRLGAVQLRELLLLSRDRNFLVQSVVVPLLIVGGQVLLGSSSLATDMWSNPSVLASVAFGLAAYSLSMSAFQTLNTEGHALWLLYTFPRSIESVLRDKAMLWGVLTLAYPLVLFGIGAAVAPALDWRFLGAMLTALLGIPIYAFIAVALGVFGSNPLEQHQAQKVKPAFVYLFMTLSGLYVYAVVTPNLVQRVIFIVLALLLAFALWQKARDQLPYLLDPDASPPSRVSTSDGLIAAMVFFVLQAISLMIIAGSSAGITGVKVLIAFCIAGGLTYALMRWVYKRAGTLDVPRLWGEPPRLLLPGIGAGLAAGAVALVYLYLINQAGWLRDAAAEQRSLVHMGWWVLPLALIAAPIFEEFIFRGIVFGGLRRSFGLAPAAIASAAIFAVMHPALGMAPVFLLGIATAVVYDRSRSLLAPMLTHAAYNATAILGARYLIY